MRILLTVIFIFISTISFSQIRFPKGFKLVKGDNGTGRDDIYTDGKYNFDTHQLFVDVDFKINSDSTRKYLSNFFGFPFCLTKDSLCWGTGTKQGLYTYVVVTASGDNIELYSKFNDSTFSYYSKWLISTIREYRKEGKDPYFPIRVGNQ
jgi:hypothetical protein